MEKKDKNKTDWVMVVLVLALFSFVWDWIKQYPQKIRNTKIEKNYIKHSFLIFLPFVILYLLVLYFYNKFGK